MASPITSKIGNGVTFPIILSSPKDEEGNTIMIPKTDIDGKVEYDEEGNPIMIPKVGWYVKSGDMNLIKNNLTSVFIYQLGERIRQENFGSRLWEALEEPNDRLLVNMVNLFIKASVAKWEPRIKALDVSLEKQNTKLLIQISFMVDSSGSVENLEIEYNSITQQYAY